MTESPQEAWSMATVVRAALALACLAVAPNTASAQADRPAEQVGTLGLIVPPRPAPAAIQAYGRALEEAETATLSRPDAGPPFVDAVLREKDSTFTVYVISQKPDETAPAPPATSPGSVVIGRDFIVRVAANGRQVLSVEKLHDSVASLSLLPRAPGAPLLHEHDKG